MTEEGSTRGWSKPKESLLQQSKHIEDLLAAILRLGKIMSSVLVFAFGVMSMTSFNTNLKLAQ